MINPFKRNKADISFQPPEGENFNVKLSELRQSLETLNSRYKRRKKLVKTQYGILRKWTK